MIGVEGGEGGGKKNEIIAFMETTTRLKGQENLFSIFRTILE